MSGQHAVMVKRDRHTAIRRIVTAHPIGSQGELVTELSALGFEVTQATVSRDIAELGLAKVMRGDRSVYVVPEAKSAPAPPVGRAPPADPGLHPGDRRPEPADLVLVGQPGTASVIGQAIDESTSSEQVGTLAGDNTLIVLFADEPALQAWLERFERSTRRWSRWRASASPRSRGGSPRRRGERKAATSTRASASE